MATIDTKTIEQNIVKILPQVIEELSFLSRAGAGAISDNVDTFHRNSPGLLHAIDEGDAKSVVPVKWESWQKQTKTLAGFTDRVSTRQLNTDQGKLIARQLTAGLVSQMPVSADIVTTHGVNPATGLPLSGDVQSLVSMGSNVYKGDANIMQALDAAKSTNVRAKALAVDESVYGFLANLRDPNGQYIYPGIDPDVPFRYGNLSTVVSPNVRVPGEVGVVEPSTLLAVLGDFKYIQRAITNVSVEWFHNGDPDLVGRDLGNRNEHVARVECEYTWVIDPRAKFTLLHDGEAPTSV